jgi:hypothetical protein
MKRKNDLDLKELPNIIEEGGGARVQLRDHINDPARASTLSEVIEKLRQKGGTVAKMVNNPVAKKAMLGLAGPAGIALNAADAMASVDEVGQGSDQVDPYMNEEALLENEPQNFADPEVSEQARRWQKIRSLMGQQ